LLSVVEYHKPNLLISLGDWDEAVDEAEFSKLLKRVKVWSIYGNHDNLGVLANMYNTVAGKLESIIMDDGEFREFDGLGFGAINRIIALKRKEKKGVPRKKPK